MSDNKMIDVEYEFIDDGKGDLMLVIEAPDSDFTDDEEDIKFIFDGNSSGRLVRKADQIINIPVINEPYLSMLNDRELLLVTEMDGEDIHDVYEAAIEKQESAW